MPCSANVEGKLCPAKPYRCLIVGIRLSARDEVQKSVGKDIDHYCCDSRELTETGDHLEREPGAQTAEEENEYDPDPDSSDLIKTTFEETALTMLSGKTISNCNLDNPPVEIE